LTWSWPARRIPDGRLGPGARPSRRRPHLIYLPERPFSLEQFVADVQQVYGRLGRCLVTVSEGIADSSGEAIVRKFIKDVDSYGNARLSGSGALGDLLADEIKAKTEITRIRADTLGYLQRSFPGLVSAVDAREARQVACWRCGRPARRRRTAPSPSGANRAGVSGPLRARAAQERGARDAAHARRVHQCGRQRRHARVCRLCRADRRSTAAASAVEGREGSGVEDISEIATKRHKIHSVLRL